MSIGAPSEGARLLGLVLAPGLVARVPHDANVVRMRLVPPDVADARTRTAERALSISEGMAAA